MAIPSIARYDSSIRIALGSRAKPGMTIRLHNTATAA